MLNSAIRHREVAQSFSEGVLASGARINQSKNSGHDAHTQHALAQYLLSSEHGSEVVRDMIVEDIQTAQRGGKQGARFKPAPCPPSLFADASRSSTG
jgi:hypothetical protein